MSLTEHTCDKSRVSWEANLSHYTASLYKKSLYTVRDYVWPLRNDISQLKNILENIVMHWELCSACMKLDLYRYQDAGQKHPQAFS